ncbi:MAG: oligopeptide transporter, OPT family [Planctomycetes bacterium]|nr:oligopeptide transporter, OPT family [Planctomycetota bacterium]
MTQAHGNETAGVAAEHKPFVPPEVVMRETTARGLVLGALLGIVFAASSTYLGLKVGLTVSASIPCAVIAITVLRWLEQAFMMKKSTILENNIVQTTGSAGESIAAGVAFTLPSLLLMGFDLELARILLVGLFGGLIGVLMMIPLRQGLIVKEHGKLMYPEGTACADVLIVGEQGGTSAKTVFLGFFVGLGYAFLNLIAKVWAESASFAMTFKGKLVGGTFSFDVSPTMLGVGYIIGSRTAANMMAGGMLAFLVLIPLIHHFGDQLEVPAAPAVVRSDGTAELVRDMSPDTIRNKYILYIGAGAVAMGGFIALARSIPSILAAFAAGLRNLRGGIGAGQVKRTERDLPITVVIGGSLAIAVAIWLSPILEIRAFSAVLIVLFGFFFVTVSSRITGEIGSSSNPISGMTIATLLLTCGLFVWLGWIGVSYKAMALTTAALVCVAASNGGTISQDLKTGFLVGATPRAQQLSIMVGVITSALVIGFVLLLLNKGYTTLQPVDYGWYTVPKSESPQRMKGPQDAEYNVLFVAEEILQPDGPARIPRGKYLYDETMRIRFYVDSAIANANSYGWALKPPEQPLTAEVARDAPVELGLDHKPYRVKAIGTKQKYFVADDGNVAYVAEAVAKCNAPKAQLFQLIIDGTLGGSLPWGLVIMGAILAILMELVRVSSLPFAVGLYLPLATSAGIFVGGLVRLLVDRRSKGVSAAQAEFSPGMLMASGLIAGGAITGVLQSLIAVLDKTEAFDVPKRLVEPDASGEVSSFGQSIADLLRNEHWWPMLPFLLMAIGLYWVGTRNNRSNASN